MTSSYPDALVLNVYSTNEESQYKNYFIWHDNKTDLFYIRGYTENDHNKILNSSFECEKVRHLTNFIKFAFEYADDNVCYELMNYLDLPLNSEEITYAFLDDNHSKAIEINTVVDMTCKRLEKTLKMMRGIYNEY